MALTLRTIKGSRLTHEELDGNFRHLTGSHEVSGSITAVAFSGSFSGSFVGDGSGLTGISAGAADLTGTGVVSGSSQLDGSVFGNTADIAASGSFSGSFEGDGSGLTGISATAFPHIGEAQITGSLKTTDKVEIYNKAGGSGNILEISAGTAFGTGASGFRFTKNTGTLVNNAHAAFSNLILQVEDGVFNMYRGGAGAKAVITMKSADGHISASLFSGSFAGDGSGLTGITATSALEGSGYVGTADVDYYTDPTMLKRDNFVMRNANVTIGVPPASNFPLGTVVEFDIYIPTGSTWTLACLDTDGNYQPGFMAQGNKGFDQLDFNPQFNVIGNFATIGYGGLFNSLSSQFTDSSGDAYHEGPALVRMVAMFNTFNTATPTTPASNASGYIWAVRIIDRLGMSNSPGTNLAVEVVTALPSSGNAKGDLVLYDDGLGMRLHFYDGTSWEQL